MIELAEIGSWISPRNEFAIRGHIKIPENSMNILEIVFRVVDVEFVSADLDYN